MPLRGCIARRRSAIPHGGAVAEMTWVQFPDAELFHNFSVRDVFQKSIATVDSGPPSSGAYGARGFEPHVRCALLGIFSTERVR